MLRWLLDDAHFVHVLAVLVLVSRLGDVISTLLISPTFALEANALARRFKRSIIVLGFCLVAVPYHSTALGVLVLVPSLLVTSSNLSSGWVARALGEQELVAFFERAARQTTRVSAVGYCIAAAIPFALSGVVLLVLSGGPESWGYWFALGMLVYALARAVHATSFALRLISRVRRKTVDVGTG